MLDIGALHAFYCVGKSGGIGAAARELNVTQPAVSQRLKKLEEQLKRKLYGKAGRRLVLTEEGQRLLEACRQVFDILGSVEAALEGGEQPLLGTVRIAALSEFSKTFLLPLVRAFRRKNQAIEFDIQYRLPYEMMISLSRHEVDFAFSNELYKRPQVESIPGFKEEILCVGPRPSRRLSWQDLEKTPWLSYGSEDPLWYEFEQTAMRRRVQLPRPGIRVADVESILRLVCDGAGYALVPAHAMRLRRSDGLAVHRLPFPNFSRKIYFCRLKTVDLGRAAQAFWDFLLKHAPEMKK